MHSPSGAGADWFFSQRPMLQSSLETSDPAGYALSRTPDSKVFLSLAKTNELQECVLARVPADPRPQPVHAPIATHVHEGLGHDCVDDALPSRICQAFLGHLASWLISHMPQENLAHRQHRIGVLFQVPLQPFKSAQPAEQPRGPAFQPKLLQGLDDCEDCAAMIERITT